MKGASNIAPFGLRMPDELKQRISELAKKNGRSMNAEIVSIIENHFAASGAGNNEFLQFFREVRAMSEGRAKEIEDIIGGKVKNDKDKDKDKD
ncbi:Arc family DNA-binding protein [Yersinia intermedia]|uniref:Arc family DNA-binding protein n=2 Tax=Yersinia TaxID=629 RepID=UPI0022FDDE0A|nr:Arc family DNA-binding protein [Yersinia intermedia]MDA5495943.1 Arc family DNA-binding protein [Yersinia intermedia]